jgi:hypothetical protein
LPKASSYLKISNCLKIVREFINSRLEGEIEDIIDDFEAASRFLSRCFSLSLTLQRPTSDLSITPSELADLVRIIDRKQMLPARLTSPLSFVEVVGELAAVRDRVARLPNFAQGAGVLRMIFAVKHLRKEFPEEAIMLADFFKEERGKQGEAHVIRVQDNDRFYYNR